MRERKTHPNDRVLCELCDVYYSRSNVSRHKQTRAHKMLDKKSLMIKNIIYGETTRPKVLSARKFKQYLSVKEIRKEIEKIVSE